MKNRPLENTLPILLSWGVARLSKTPYLSLYPKLSSIKRNEPRNPTENGEGGLFMSIHKGIKDHHSPSAPSPQFFSSVKKEEGAFYLEGAPIFPASPHFKRLPNGTIATQWLKLFKTI